MLNIYISASHKDASRAQALRTRLRTAGFECLHSFAEDSFEAEHLDRLSLTWVRTLLDTNDDALATADTVVALASDGADVAGEVRHALELGIPVVWVGAHRPLTAFRRGVVRALGDDDAFHLVWAFGEFVKRPWPAEKDWERLMVWELVERLSHKEEDDVPEGGAAAHAAG